MPHDGPLPHTSHTGCHWNVSCNGLTRPGNATNASAPAPPGISGSAVMTGSASPCVSSHRSRPAERSPRRCDFPRRTTDRARSQANRHVRRMSAVPTLERLDTRALRDVITRFATPCAKQAGAQPAERVPGARRRHGHEHGPHARRRGGGGRETPSRDLDATCDAISHGSLMGARGNTGVILQQILRGLAGVLKQGRGCIPGRGRRGVHGGLGAAPTRRCSSRSKARS